MQSNNHTATEGSIIIFQLINNVEIHIKSKKPSHMLNHHVYTVAVSKIGQPGHIFDQIFHS